MVLMVKSGTLIEGVVIHITSTYIPMSMPLMDANKLSPYVIIECLDKILIFFR